MAAGGPDPLVHTTRWRVRSYEIDRNGHVNNAVYLNYAEALTAEHAEVSGYGRAWSQERGGGWVIRRHEIEYRRPAVLGDELELTVRVELVRGVRGVRRTTITRVADGAPVAEVLSEWVWVRLADGRPVRPPAELVAAAAEVTAATLARARLTDGHGAGRASMIARRPWTSTPSTTPSARPSPT